MAKVKKTEAVPKAMQAKFEGIVAITNDFSKTHLNDEYAQLIRYAVSDRLRCRRGGIKLGPAGLPTPLVWSTFYQTRLKTLT